MSKFGIGQPVKRYEDPRLLTGKGRFINDVNLAGQAYAAVARSPHAHARLSRSILRQPWRRRVCWRSIPARISPPTVSAP